MEVPILTGVTTNCIVEKVGYSSGSTKIVTMENITSSGGNYHGSAGSYTLINYA